MVCEVSRVHIYASRANISSRLLHVFFLLLGCYCNYDGGLYYGINE